MKVVWAKRWTVVWQGRTPALEPLAEQVWTTNPGQFSASLSPFLGPLQSSSLGVHPVNIPADRPAIRPDTNSLRRTKKAPHLRGALL